MSYGLKISHNLITADDIIMTVRKVSAPLADVVSPIFYPAPHSQVNVTVTVPDPVMYKVQFWKTTDGVTLDSIFGGADIDGGLVTGASFSIIQFEVGRGNGAPNYDPTAGDAQYVNPDLDGLTSADYVVHKPGFGPLSWESQIQTIPGGGFEFTDDQVFFDEEKYTIVVSTVQTASTPPPSDLRDFPSKNTDVAADYTLDPTADKNANLIISGLASPRPIITITDLAALSDFQKFGINTDAGIGATLQLPSGRFCNVNGQSRNAVYVGPGEQAIFYKVSTTLFVESWKGNQLRTGELVFKGSVAPLGGIAAVGGWQNKDGDFQRLYEWYVAELSPGELGVGTDDVTPTEANKSKWCIGAEKFWVPDLRDMFLRASDGSRTAGVRQIEQVGSHFHDVGTQPNTGLAKFLKGMTQAIRNWNTGNSNNNGQASTGVTFQNADTITATTNPENRPKNVSFIMYFIG
jgi:hypothetical protein